MVFIVTTLYKKESQKLFQAGKLKERSIEYVDLFSLTENLDRIISDNLPSFSLEKYTQIRDDVLKAEQHLLRLLNYSLENSYESHYKMLMLILKSANTPKETVKTAFTVYNDSFIYLEDANAFKQEHVVLFSILLAITLTKSQETEALTSLETRILKEISDVKAFTHQYQDFAKEMLDAYKQSKQTALTIQTLDPPVEHVEPVEQSIL